jgi:hypothetical protein
MKYGVYAHLDIYNIFILSFPVILYNIYFLFTVKFDNISIFLCTDYENINIHDFGNLC